MSNDNIRQTIFYRNAADAARSMGHETLRLEHLLLSLVNGETPASNQVLEWLDSTLKIEQTDFNALAAHWKNASYFHKGPEVLYEEPRNNPSTNDVVDTISMAARLVASFEGQKNLTGPFVFYALIEGLMSKEHLRTRYRGMVQALTEEPFALSDKNELRKALDEYVETKGNTPNYKKSKTEEKSMSENGNQPTGEKKSKTPALDHFCRDLSQLARENALDPTIGRSEEIERVQEILARRKKNNPVLIGEPGVGKTAIVEGIAQLAVSEDAPENLRGKRILSLDMAAVIAGTKYRGQFEERLKAVMNEIGQNKDEMVLFLDELHTLVGAGGAEGALDAANILKPALARGELNVIGATTLKEYRAIEKDGALERRFQPVLVEPPSPEDTFEILKGLRKKYESFHGVTFSDETLREAEKLSTRYIDDRFQPDKAIDVIDEAAARVRIKKKSALAEELGIGDLEDQLKEVRAEKDRIVGDQDFVKAADFREREKELARQIAEAKEALKRPVEVTLKDIAFIVSRATGIPVKKLEVSDRERMMGLEADLKRQVIGQDEAIEKIARAVKRNRAGLGDPDRPIGSFIFSGPTGVGKTETAKALARELFEDEDAIIRIDMSEYMEKFNVSKLVGAPPGYVGHGDGGQLTDQVRRKPYSIVLLDEIEKAHPDVFNILLQVLDDGHLTDSQGRKVNFRHTVVIMTSNLGTGNGASNPMGFQGVVSGNDQSGTDHEHEAFATKIRDAVAEAFRPEFINRVDDIVVFHHLKSNSLRQIVDLMVDGANGVNRNIEDRDLKIELSEAAKNYVAKHSYDEKFGARPMRRFIQREIEDELSDRILGNEFNTEAGGLFSVDVELGEDRKERLSFTFTEAVSSKAGTPANQNEKDAAEPQEVRRSNGLSPS